MEFWRGHIIYMRYTYVYTVCRRSQLKLANEVEYNVKIPILLHNLTFDFQGTRNSLIMGKCCMHAHLDHCVSPFSLIYFLLVKECKSWSIYIWDVNKSMEHVDFARLCLIFLKMWFQLLIIYIFLTKDIEEKRPDARKVFRLSQLATTYKIISIKAVKMVVSLT